jgi:hypothetical protein
VNWTVAGKIGLVGAAVVVAGKVFDAFKFGDIDPSGLDAVVAGGFSYLASLTDLSSADPAILGGAGYRISNLGVTKNQDGSFSNTYASVRDQSPPSERKEDR